MRLKVLIAAAAVLVSGTPVLAQDAPRPAPAAASRAVKTDAEKRAAWVADRKRLARGFPVDPEVLKASEVTASAALDSYDLAYLVSAGDLDGDKHDDLVDVRSHIVFDDTLGPQETLRLEAHRGTDGKALWTISVPPSYTAFPIFTKVGATGANGVIVASYTVTGADGVAAAGGTIDANLTSYDGKGASLWSHRSTGVAAGSVLTYSDAIAPGYGGIGNLVAGGGLDVLTLTYADVLVDVAGLTTVMGTRVQPGVLDAATGVETPLGAGFVSDDSEAWAMPVGDVDKDKRDDIAAVVLQSGKRVLTLSSSATGVVLSTPAGVPDGDYLDLYPAGDITGDGAADVIATAQSFWSIGVGDPSPQEPAPGTVALIDGGKGKVAWSKRGAEVAPIGNADKKAGGEVAVGSVTGNGSGFTVSAFNGAGKAVWSVSRAVSTAGLSRYDAASGWGNIGDTQGDGVVDLGYGIYVAPFSSAKMRRDEGTIDGRTGRARRDPVPGMAAVRIALDGRGTDALTRPWANGVLTLTAWRGDRPQRLWQTGIVAPGPGYVSPAGFLDKDKCGDIVARTATYATSTDFLVSGSTGLPLWGVSRTGPAKGKVFRPAVRSHARYVRTC
jgi:hypothetical protein